MELNGLTNNIKLKSILVLADKLQKEQDLSKEDALKAAALQLKNTFKKD